MKVKEVISQLDKLPANSHIVLYSFKGKPTLAALIPDREECRVKGIVVPVINPYKSLYDQLKEMQLNE